MRELCVRRLEGEARALIPRGPTHRRAPRWTKIQNNRHSPLFRLSPKAYIYPYLEVHHVLSRLTNRRNAACFAFWAKSPRPTGGIDDVRCTVGALRGGVHTDASNCRDRRRSDDEHECVKRATLASRRKAGTQSGIIGSPMPMPRPPRQVGKTDAPSNMSDSTARACATGQRAGRIPSAPRRRAGTSYLHA